MSKSRVSVSSWKNKPNNQDYVPQQQQQKRKKIMYNRRKNGAFAPPSSRTYLPSGPGEDGKHHYS